MKDAITLERIKTAHPKLRKELTDIYNAIVAALTGRAIARFSYVIRTFAEQDALYAQGRTKPGPIVTKSRGGFSYHNYGLAVDIVLLWDKDGNGTYETATWDIKTDFDGDKKSDWMEIVQIFRNYGWTWGGDWNNNLRSDDEKFLDYPHFQKTMGHSVMELLELKRKGAHDGDGYVFV